MENIDLSTKMLGTKVDIPFYVTATALGKLGNPEGEVSTPELLCSFVVIVIGVVAV